MFVNAQPKPRQASPQSKAAESRVHGLFIVSFTAAGRPRSCTRAVVLSRPARHQRQQRCTTAETGCGRCRFRHGSEPTTESAGLQLQMQRPATQQPAQVVSTADPPADGRRGSSGANNISPEVGTWSPAHQLRRQRWQRLHQGESAQDRVCADGFIVQLYVGMNQRCLLLPDPMYASQSNAGAGLSRRAAGGCQHCRRQPVDGR
jgi:hypothetical protein